MLVGEWEKKADEVPVWQPEKIGLPTEYFDCSFKNYEDNPALIKRLSAYKKRIVNNKLMLKSNLLFTMQDTEKTKFMTEFHQFGTRKSKAVNIIDSELIPSAYMKEKTTWTVDKVKIKDVINSGEAVEGAEIVERESLVIK